MNPAEEYLANQLNDNPFDLKLSQSTRMGSADKLYLADLRISRYFLTQIL